MYRCTCNGCYDITYVIVEFCHVTVLCMLFGLLSAVLSLVSECLSIQSINFTEYVPLTNYMYMYMHSVLYMHVVRHTNGTVKHSSSVRKFSPHFHKLI